MLTGRPLGRLTLLNTTSNTMSNIYIHYIIRYSIILYSSANSILLYILFILIPEIL